MKTLSRMPTMAGRTCLLFFLCTLAGCWDSHPKQEAGDRPAHDQPSATADSSAAKPSATPPARRSDEDFGFKETWKPGSPPPAKTSAAEPAVIAHRDGEDNRYQKSVPAPIVGNKAATDWPLEPPPSSPAKAADTARSAIPDMPEPYVPGPAIPGPVVDAPPGGNPLRDPRAGAASGRPEEVLQPAAASDPIIVAPERRPPVDPSPPPGNSELLIQVKPEPATAPQSPPPIAPVAPVTPAAPAIEKKPEPPEHGPAPVGTGPHTNKNSGIPFDPVKENGPIFVDWPKPKLALVITGNQEGYLEPCGCAGLDRMKGGMSRRYELFQMLRQDPKYGWPVLGIDVGGTAKGFGKQAELKFQIAVNAMSEMRYSAVTLGLTDLRLPTADVMALTMPAAANKKTMFVSGNVGLFDFDESLLPRTQLIAAGDKRIGITAVLGKTYMAQLAGNTELKITPAETLLDKAVPLLKPKANFLILLAQTTREEAIDLAKKYPDFDLVICSDHFKGGAEPPAQAEEIQKGGTKLIAVGEKGMYAVVLGMYDDPKQPLRYQRVTLDSRFPASKEMNALMSAYQGQLKDLGLGGLGIHPQLHPLREPNGDFVGTDACTKCHEESYRVWKKSSHSRAFATLQNVVPPRTFDPECISCHTVGWNPSSFLPYQSGYLSEKETPKLINVGCENCHGPGQWHVRAENVGTKAEQVAARASVRITKEESADPNSRKQNCWSCHDLDNSPEFKFDLYWPYVKHYEHE